MSRLSPFLSLIVPAVMTTPLFGCASVGGASAASAQIDAARSFVAAETGFDVAVQTADAAIKSGQLTMAKISAIKSDVDKGYTYVQVGRLAVTTINATDLISATSSLMILIADLTTLTRG